MADVKGTLRLIARISTAATAPPIVITGPISTIRGVKWCIKIKRDRDTHGPTLHFALASSDNRLARVKCRYSCRIDNLHLHHTGKSFEFGKDAPCAPYILIGYVSSLQTTVADGEFTLEIDVEPGVPEFLPGFQSRVVGNALSFDQLMFTDMVVGVEGEEETIPCNKEVVARHSKVIFVAMTTESTKEYQSGRFVIGHFCATLVNVRLMVKGMYGDLEESELKEHSTDLLRLAHMYESERVSEIAVDALKRHISTNTFWRTIEVAVELDNKALIDVCAQFADRTPDAFKMLAKRADGRAMMEDAEKQTVVNELWLAMAK